MAKKVKKEDWNWMMRLDREFSLDEEAHLKGRCSFSSTALCLAEEHRVKRFFRDFIRQELKRERERVINKFVHIYI